MANFYCEYCGLKFPSVQTLTSGTCSKHPNGANKDKHSLYQGSEKSKYTCKYCGLQFPNLVTLTAGICSKHPNGNNKGRHSPAL